MQLRFPENAVNTDSEISIRGRQYTIGRSIPQTLGHSALPMGVIMNGYTRQYELLHDGQAVGAAWFYFYTAFEGKSWAVLDEAELPLEEGSDAA